MQLLHLKQAVVANSSSSTSSSSSSSSSSTSSKYVGVVTSSEMARAPEVFASSLKH